jgi:formyltetrahydrofolate deformylase
VCFVVVCGGALPQFSEDRCIKFYIFFASGSQFSVKRMVMVSAILLMHCPDQKGLVAAVTDFLYRHSGNILHLDQHVDIQTRTFFMRVEWDLKGFGVDRSNIAELFQVDIAERFGMHWHLHFSDDVPRVALFVSKLSHCLHDVLARWQSGQWQVEIPVVISNHKDMEEVVTRFGLSYYYLPITKKNKVEQERRQLELLKDHQVELVVLARYMQILSADFLAHYPERVINIHHSFLPAFPGARPYHAAQERGVKIIGATSHYVTADLDAGPIIEQDVARVNHRDTVDDMVRKGQDLEKVVLARAIWYHLNRRVLVYGNRTVVFS